MVDWRKMTAGVQERCRGVFGTPALYRVDGQGAGDAIRGIFRDENADGEAALEIDLATIAPEFHVLEVDLPAGALVGEDDTVELTELAGHTGIQYRVRDEGPDGEGMIALALTLES